MSGIIHMNRSMMIAKVNRNPSVRSLPVTDEIVIDIRWILGYRLSPGLNVPAIIPFANPRCVRPSPLPTKCIPLRIGNSTMAVTDTQNKPNAGRLRSLNKNILKNGMKTPSPVPTQNIVGVLA